MKLTACLIVKNEERCLARCLNSLRGAVDEIVVGDTGSADATREIAREWGARVLDLPWRDDFAWAKNQVLDAADGDWVLFPDADEYFAPGGAAALRALAEASGTCPELDGIVLRRYEGTALPASFSAVIRAFRLSPDMRFAGAIHESLSRGGRLPRLLDAPENIFLWHDGYAGARAAAKIARDTRIIEKQLRSGSDDALLLFHMGKMLDRQKEQERIWEYMESFLRRDTTPSSICLKAMLLAEIALAFAPDARIAGERRRWLAGEALRRFPAQPGAYLIAGGEAAERGDWREAMKMYARAAGLWESGFDDFGDSDYRQEKIRPLVYARLGRYRKLSGDTEGALADFAAALEREPDNPDAVAGYIECSRAASAETVAGALSVWMARCREPLGYLAAARAKRCDLLYLLLYDRHFAGQGERAPRRYFATMQVLAGAWHAAAADCGVYMRRHPLWDGDGAAFFAALLPPERAETGAVLAEAVAGCLLAASGWNEPAGAWSGAAVSADPAVFLRALAALAPPALSDAIRLSLGEEVETPRREGLELVTETGERLGALAAPEEARAIWREAAACFV
ncbi:MAG: glycosyltransferase [Gracilibacteraceae bacterium]|jgi:glycosyltransferase involved in cell wall biosynthesis|nr:glycosyltransferase [Gracilibacteraceae bacterium]